MASLRLTAQVWEISDIPHGSEAPKGAALGASDERGFMAWQIGDEVMRNRGSQPPDRLRA